jgi:hypothetical protein
MVLATATVASVSYLLDHIESLPASLSLISSHSLSSSSTTTGTLPTIGRGPAVLTCLDPVGSPMHISFSSSFLSSCPPFPCLKPTTIFNFTRNLVQRLFFAGLAAMAVMVGGCGSAVTVVSCASWRFTSVRFAGSESEKCEEDLLWKRTEVMGRRCLELFGAILSLKRMGQSEVQCGKFKLVAHEVRERR